MLWPLHETSLLNALELSRVLSRSASGQAKAKKKETAACKADLTDGFALESKGFGCNLEGHSSSIQRNLHKALARGT